MKPLQLLQLLLILTVLLACSKEPEAKWKLLWEDDFSRKDFIDTSKWSYIDRNYNLDREAIPYSISSFVKVEEGNLVLTTLVIKDKNGNDRAIGGGLQTKNKKSIKYGKVEVRAKFGSAQGINSAIWMLADKPKYEVNNPEYKKYAHYNGEIDIVEHINFDTNIYQTIHTYYTYKLKENNPPNQIKLKKDASKYVIYGVEIYEDKIVLFVDGQKTFEYPRIETNKIGQFPFDQDYYLIMEQGLGKKDSWQGGIDFKDLPVKMYIDWVKFYEKDE